MVLSSSFLLFVSCQKHAEKIVGTYVGTLTQNDSIYIEDVSVRLKETDKQKVSVESDYFGTYEVTVDRKRYFSSVSYFYNGTNEDFEVTKDDLLTLSKTEENGNSFSFYGNKQ